MGTYPDTRSEFLNWCEAHTDLWSANAAAIGITPAQALSFKNNTGAMRSTVTAQAVAKDAARSATKDVTTAESTLRATASDLVRFIRAFAEASANPNAVYTAAQIPPPAKSSPVAPPGQPTNFREELNPGGSITISWKAAHPEGSDRVVYFVQRKLNTQANFSLVGGTGERKYLDATLPANSGGATYIVTAQRGQVSGAPSQELSISLGVSGSGLTVTGGTLSMAA